MSSETSLYLRVCNVPTPRQKIINGIDLWQLQCVAHLPAALAEIIPFAISELASFHDQCRAFSALRFAFPALGSQIRFSTLRRKIERQLARVVLERDDVLEVVEG